MSVKPHRRAGAPCVLWFTGLSGAGKSTIAARLCSRLKARGVDVEYLDGDRLREIFPGTGFTAEERDRHIRRVGFMAGLLERHGVTVVVALVSPYRASRRAARALCRRFVEVYVATPLAECERRDVKGLYARARRGEVRNFTGISDPYEPPIRPELTIQTTGRSVGECVDEVLHFLTRTRRSRGRT